MSAFFTVGLFFSGPLFAQETDQQEVYPLIAETTDNQAVFFSNKDAGWIVGNVQGTNGTIFKTDDGGNTWQIQEDIASQLHNITCATTSICLAVGDKGVALRTIDGGDTWVSLKTGIQNDLTDGYIGDGGKNILIVGEGGMIRRSTDGGVTWKTITASTKKTLTSIHSVSAKAAWITGEGGLLLKSVDGGATWKTQKSGTNKTQYDMYAVSPQKFFTVGAQGAVTKTTNAGTTWSQLKTNSSTELRSVHFIDGNYGIVVGMHGVLNTTANGGLSWDELDSGTDATLHSVRCAARDFCVVVGDKGTVLLFDLSAGTFITEEDGQDQGEATPQEDQPVQEEQHPQPENLPDLTITSVTPGLNTLSFKVKNIGSAATGLLMGMKASYQWLDADGNPNSIAPAFIDGLALQPLASNADATVQILPTSPPAAIYQKLFFQNNIPSWAAKLKITVDGTNQLTEANEDNNSIIIDRPTTNIVGVAGNSSLSSTLFAFAVKNEGPLTTPANMKVYLRWLKTDGTTASGSNASTSIAIPQAIDPGVTKTIAYAKDASTTPAWLANVLFNAVPSDAVKLEVTPGKDEFAAFVYHETNRADNAILLPKW